MTVIGLFDCRDESYPAILQPDGSMAEFPPWTK
jgi:hypothetical protein